MKIEMHSSQSHPMRCLIRWPEIINGHMHAAMINSATEAKLPTLSNAYIPILVYLMIELHTVYQRTRQSWRDFFNFWRYLYAGIWIPVCTERERERFLHICRQKKLLFREKIGNRQF